MTKRGKSPIAGRKAHKRGIIDNKRRTFHRARKSSTIRLRFPPLLETAIRWGLIMVLASLLMGSASANRQALESSAALASEKAKLDKERNGLSDELRQFSDPEWLEGYWKWKTMRHDPGQEYIYFEDR